MSMGLDGRQRDKNEEISREHGDAWDETGIWKVILGISPIFSSLSPSFEILARRAGLGIRRRFLEATRCVDLKLGWPRATLKPG